MDFSVDDPPGKESYPVETDKPGKLGREHFCSPVPLSNKIKMNVKSKRRQHCTNPNKVC